MEPLGPTPPGGPPPEDAFDYQAMLQRALRSVVREALDLVVEVGVPVDHAVYLTFRTDHPGVKVPRQLSQRYPEEMTVVLQNQYWDPVSDDEAFSVVLAFGGDRRRIVLPWDAITVYADPEAEFALRLDPDALADSISAEDDEDGSPWSDASRKEAGDTPAKESSDKKEDDSGDDEAEDGKVISMDRFRNKKKED